MSERHPPFKVEEFLRAHEPMPEPTASVRDVVPFPPASSPVAAPSQLVTPESTPIERLRMLADEQTTEFVASFLQHHHSLPPIELTEAVFLAEERYIMDRVLRARFAEAILSSARLLLERDPTSLGARMALRKFASLAPMSMLDALGDFLGAQRDLTVKQVTLEAIWNAYVVKPLARGSLELRARVARLAMLYADPEWLCSAQGRVLHAFSTLADLVVSGEAASRRLSEYLSVRSPETTDALFLVRERIHSELDHAHESRRLFLQDVLRLLPNDV